MKAWNSWLVAGAVVMSTYLLLPSGLVRDSVYSAVGLATVVAILVGARRSAPPVRAPWYLFAVGILSWTVGDSIYSWNLDVRHTEPFPSVADAFYLAAYPLLALGVALLIRRRSARLGLAGVIDSAIVLVGLGLLSWTWIARPLLAADEVSAFERVLAVAYPLGDIILLAMLVRLVSAPGARSTAYRLLVGAVLLQVAADTALASTPSEGWDYASGLDLLWLGSYVVWAAAALHPRMSAISQRGPQVQTQFTRRRLAVLGAAALVPSLAALVAVGVSAPVDMTTVAIGSAVLTALVLARTACAVGEIRAAARQRDRLQEMVFEQASRDALTGLFNRPYLLRLVGEALRRGQVDGGATGLVVIDVDGLVAINDERGPQAGDAVLMEVAQRVRTVSDGQPVGRLGDHQFVVLVDQANAEDATTALAGRLAVALGRPHRTDGQELAVTARIGVTVSLDAGADPRQLLQEALIAVGRSRAGADHAFEVFDDFMRQELAHRSEIESSLRVALRKDELELYYQPVVAAVSGVVDGFEALIRWNHPDRTRLPDEFIPVAEKSDLICELGRWTLDEATRQFAAWLAADPERFGDLTIAVNISGRHLSTPDIVEDVATALEASGLPPHHLVLEVTETVLVDVPRAVLQLGSLRDLGVTISLDDFGTGFTSVAQLRRLPIDTVKIDRSFFESDEPGSSELIALMTGAAHACGLLVVAEGIERLEQLEVLLAFDCDAAQGYYFSAPVRADEAFAYGGPPSSPRLRVVKDEESWS